MENEQPAQDNTTTEVKQEPTKQADKNQVRQLKIKTGTVKRNMKDFTSYKKE